MKESAFEPFLPSGVRGLSFSYSSVESAGRLLVHSGLLSFPILLPLPFLVCMCCYKSCTIVKLYNWCCTINLNVSLLTLKTCPYSPLLPNTYDLTATGFYLYSLHGGHPNCF